MLILYIYSFIYLSMNNTLWRTDLHGHNKTFLTECSVCRLCTVDPISHTIYTYIGDSILSFDPTAGNVVLEQVIQQETTIAAYDVHGKSLRNVM